MFYNFELVYKLRRVKDGAYFISSASKTHRTNESNTLQGYVTPAIDSERVTSKGLSLL